MESGAARQDIKTSNILVFSDQDAKVRKIKQTIPQEKRTRKDSSTPLHYIRRTYHLPRPTNRPNLFLTRLWLTPSR